MGLKGDVVHADQLSRLLSQVEMRPNMVRPSARDLLELEHVAVKEASQAGGYSGAVSLLGKQPLILRRNDLRDPLLDGESVPSEEKIVSIFESHTDIIVKDRRETLYGHKLFLAAGASGLITDCVIADGNPADTTMALPCSCGRSAFSVVCPSRLRSMVASLRKPIFRVPRPSAFARSHSRRKRDSPSQT
jgi:hypothetical protein